MFFVAGTSLFLSPQETRAATVGKSPAPINNLKSGLVGYWTFDGKDMLNGKALDKSGNGNNGNLVGIATSTFYTAGKIGQGFKFRGAPADYLNIPSMTSFTYPYSISVWFNIPVLGRNGVFTSIAGGSYGNGFYYASNNKIIYLSSATKYLYSSKVFASSDLNKWQHAVIVVPSSDVSTWKMYVNTVSTFGSNSNTGSDTAPGTSARIGVFGDGSYPFKGSLDDVRIYNRALTAGEIKQLYNLGR